MNYEFEIALRNEADNYKRFHLFHNKIDEIYNNFKNNTKQWENMSSYKDRIATHHISYDSDDVDSIIVAYNKVIVYANFIIEKYVESKYIELGIDNFFRNLIRTIGPITQLNIEDLDTYKLKILNNALDLIKFVSQFYNKFKTYVGGTESYVANINWFNDVIQQSTNILDTIYDALKSYIE